MRRLAADGDPVLGIAHAVAKDESLAAASPRLQVDYAAAYFAEYLRGSQYGEDVSLATLADLADGAAEQTDDRDVADLADLIRRAD